MVESESKRTPESDVNFYLYDLQKNTSENSLQDVLSTADPLLSALAKCTNVEFENGRKALRILAIKINKVGGVPSEELGTLVNKYPGLSIWHDLVFLPKSEPDPIVELRKKIQSAREDKDYLEVRKLSLKLLNRLSRTHPDRDRIINEVCGTFIELDDLEPRDKTRLRQIWLSFENYINSQSDFTSVAEMKYARENFNDLVHTFLAVNLDSTVQMARCLRGLKRSDLAYEILSKINTYDAKFFNFYYDNTMLSVLLDLRRIDESEFFAERLERYLKLNPKSPSIVVCLWRFNKFRFFETSEVDYLEKMVLLCEKMKELEVHNKYYIPCQRETNKLVSDTDEVLANRDKGPLIRNSAPSIALIKTSEEYKDFMIEFADFLDFD